MFVITDMSVAAIPQKTLTKNFRKKKVPKPESTIEKEESCGQEKRVDGPARENRRL